MHDKRLKKEEERFKQVALKSRNLRKQYIQAGCIDGDLGHWKGVIEGPETTFYTGGIFSVDFQLPAKYPLEPPRVHFDTRIWHPNIDPTTGYVRLDILESEWEPTITICTVLTLIQSLMAVPKPFDSQDKDPANMYLLHYFDFRK